MVWKMRSLSLMEFSLRISAIPLTAASLWVMVTNKQANDAYGEVEFRNLSGMKYLVCTNAISLGYALAAVIFVRCLTCDWILFVLDQVIAYLLVTSGSAVIEVLYLAYKGDSEVSWSSARNYYGKFCKRAEVSLALHMLALVCFLGLSLISAYRAFSKFEPPVNPKEAGEDEE